MKKYFILVLLLVILYSIDKTPLTQVESFDVVGSYNILNDSYDTYNWYESYDVRVEQIAKNIINSGSDIIGLFEVNDMELLMSYLPAKYDYIYKEREEIGVAIIYNTHAVTLKQSSCRSFLYQNTSNMGYCFATFQDNITNEDILFVATHIAYIEPNDNYIQLKQVQELVAFINRYKNYYDQFYLVGDFNIDESYNMQYDIIAYLETYNINCNTANTPTFPVSDLTLDYICGDVEEVNVIDDTTSSDHNLIYAEIDK